MTAMFPLAVWQPGTLQPSTPVNDNALRVEVLQRGALSILSTPPGSPADGDVHILGASPTGAWSTFAQNDVVLWRSGTWYRFAPFTGWLKQVGSDVRRYSGTAWEVVTGSGGGGAVPVQEEGTTVVASPTAINFVGAGVTATNSGGVATVTIPGGGAGAAPVAWEGYATVNPDTTTSSTFGITAPTATSGGSSAKTISSASKLAALPRRSHNATASASALGGVRGSNGLVFFMATANCGGSEVEMIVSPGLGATVSSHRFFGGWLSNNNAPSDVNPSTLTNIVGIGYDSGDTNLQFMHNDGSGTATKVDLGSSLPKPSAAEAAAYLIRITSTVPGEVSYFVENIITGNTASGTVSTDLPTVGLNWQSWQSAGGTSTAIEHLWAYSRLKVFA